MSYRTILAQADGNSLHGGATAMLVDVIGSVVIYSVGLLTTGVSVEINVSYFDAPSLDVRTLSSSSAFHTVLFCCNRGCVLINSSLVLLSV